jgi:hypothetical protein
MSVVHNGENSLMTISIVRVRWIDTWSAHGWIDQEVFEKCKDEPDCEIDSVGFLVDECDRHIILAFSLGKGQIGDIMKISKQAITHLEVLKDSGKTLKEIFKENVF